jgi:hypothetical protein
MIYKLYCLKLQLRDSWSIVHGPAERQSGDVVAVTAARALKLLYHAENNVVATRTEIGVETGVLLLLFLFRSAAETRAALRLGRVPRALLRPKRV